MITSLVSLAFPYRCFGESNVPRDHLWLAFSVDVNMRIFVMYTGPRYLPPVPSTNTHRTGHFSPCCVNTFLRYYFNLSPRNTP